MNYNGTIRIGLETAYLEPGGFPNLIALEAICNRAKLRVMATK